MPEQMNKRCWVMYCHNKSDVLLQQLNNKYGFPVCANHALDETHGFLFEAQRLAAEVVERLTDGNL